MTPLGPVWDVFSFEGQFSTELSAFRFYPPVEAHVISSILTLEFVLSHPKS